MDGLRFVIYDKADDFQRSLSGLDGTADMAPNVIPTATFVVDDDHEALGPITAKGARCGVWFRGVERFRGRIRETPGAGPEGTITAHVEGDLRKLWDWHGWPAPANAIGSQTSEYRTYTGKAETVFKTALAETVDRLGVPWSVAADLARGVPTVSAAFRFHPLADKLIPLLDAEGLTVVLAYVDGEVVVDVRPPATVPGVLTLATGIPDSYAFNLAAPTATRAVVGGRGEGVERELVQVVDAEREDDWGDIIETFVDARNNDEGADLAAEGTVALAEGAPRVSASTELVETGRFRFGTTYDIGDLVHVRLGPVDTTERLSVSITESVDQGVVVTPRIGSLDTDADVDVQLAQQIARLARGFRDQGRR